MTGRALALALVLVASAPATAGPVAQKLFDLPERADPADAAGPLDVRAVSFGQRGGELWLTVRTEGEWDAGDLPERAFCLRLRAGALCIGRDAQVRFRSRAVPADVDRPDRRTLVARVHPHDLRLRFGVHRWSLAALADRVPDAGTFGARVSALGGPRCFGAGSRPGRPCRAVGRTVTPAPRTAQVTSDFPCAPLGRRRGRAITPCAFGFPRGRPRIALVGDSHAAHWRAAVDVAARAAGLRAVSLTSPGCSFSTEVYPAPAPIPARCRAHTREALRWLRNHRSVERVVTSSSAGRGLSPGGYTSVWSQVPASVRRIHVIRDVPRVSHATAGCVTSVRRRGAEPSGACSVARGGAFPADTSAQAAARAGGRVRLHDLSRRFCTGSRCHPVIGGAYVYRDFNHMNPVFNSTLGPHLLRALRLR